MEEVNRVALELVQLYKRDLEKPFPYPGCRMLLSEADKQMEGFIPDLDLYFADITGICSSAKMASRWDENKIKTAEKIFRHSFFEMHPEYQELEDKITPENTPDLHSDMALHEEMRVKCLHLITLLKEPR